MEVLTPSVGRNPNELLRQLAAFQLVRETGVATPSGWQPGKPVLKPGRTSSATSGRNGSRAGQVGLVRPENA
jgi:alkyl hydroperoxide reductase subunit AhpC